jgi:hypothetical protein
MGAIKDRLPGQQTLHQLIEADKFYYFEDALVERDPRLEQNQMPYCSAMEFPGYTWLPGKDDMSHEDDHGMDTDRYATHTTLKRRSTGKARII